MYYDVIFFPSRSSHLKRIVAKTKLNILRSVLRKSFVFFFRLVYEGVREIRRVFLLNRGRMDEDMDSDTEWENPEVAESEVAESEVAETRPGSATAEVMENEYQGISGTDQTKTNLTHKVQDHTFRKNQPTVF